MAAIETRSLSIGYRLGKGRQAVVHEGLDLTLATGEVTCLLGLNGAGKSTLIKTLCGFIEPLAGEIVICGKPLGSYSKNELSRTMGVVLTEKTNAGGISVRGLVALGRYPYTGFFGRLSEEDYAKIDRALEAVGMNHKAGSHISELSDGERQKVFIAKALAQECPVIILDEPTAFLDVTSRIETMVLLRRIAHEEDRAILLSTHDLESSLQLADRFWLQEKGSPMLCGTPESLVADGTLERFFSRGQLHFDPIQRRIVAETAQ